jgi:hypothetical protein
MYYNCGGFGNGVVVVDCDDGGSLSGDGSGRCRFNGVYTCICIYIYIISMPIALAVRSKASAVALLLWLWNQIPPEAWLFVTCECCMLTGRGLCVWLITRREKSYRGWCVWVWSWSLKNEEVLAHWGLLHHEKKNKNISVCVCVCVCECVCLCVCVCVCVCLWKFKHDKLRKKRSERSIREQLFVLFRILLKWLKKTTETVVKIIVSRRDSIAIPSEKTNGKPVSPNIP